MKFKISNIRINNFFSFKEAKFCFLRDYNVLIGKNNAGKSNFFKILTALVSNFISGTFNKTIIFDGKYDERAEISFEYNLDVQYRKEFFSQLQEADYFSNAFHSSNRKIDDSPKIWNEETLDWLIQKNYFKSIIITFSYEPSVKGLLLESITALNNNFNTKIFNTKFSDKKISLEFLDRDGLTRAKTLKEFFKKSLTIEPVNFSPYVNSLQGFHQNFISNNYKLSKKKIHDYFPFYKIYNDIVLPLFKSFLYFPYDRHFEKANDILKLEDTIPYPYGANISKFLANMKLNNPTWLNEFNSELKDFFLNLNEFSSTSESDQTIFHAKEEGLNESLRLENLGTGLLNIVNFLINLKYYDKEKSIFLIEEPELFIFPGLQKKVRKKLISFSKTHQVFITTHSPNFLSRDFKKCSIYKIKKNNTHSIVEKISDENLKDIFRELDLSFYDYILYDGFLFVEGPKDIEVFEIFVEKLIEKNLKLIPTEGKNNFIHYASANILKFLDNNLFNYLFIMDRDRGNVNFYKRLQDKEYRELVKEKIVPLFTYEIENIFLQPILLLDYLYTIKKTKDIKYDCGWLSNTLENIFQTLGSNNFRYLLKSINDKIPSKLNSAEIEDILVKTDNFLAASKVFDFWFESINEILKKKLDFFKNPILNEQMFHNKLRADQKRYEESLKRKDYNQIISGKKVFKKLREKIIEIYKLKEFSLETLANQLFSFLTDFSNFMLGFTGGDDYTTSPYYQFLSKLNKNNKFPCINSNTISKFKDYILNILKLLRKIQMKMNCETNYPLRRIESSLNTEEYLKIFLIRRWELTKFFE